MVKTRPLTPLEIQKKLITRSTVASRQPISSGVDLADPFGFDLVIRRTVELRITEHPDNILIPRAFSQVALTAFLDMLDPDKCRCIRIQLLP